MTPESDLLPAMAAKYIWWKTPAEALLQPDRVIAQVMNLGEFRDLERLAESVGDDTLRRIVQQAEPGLFDERSWAYWHYRLGLAAPETLPPLPVRTFV